MIGLIVRSNAKQFMKTIYRQDGETIDSLIRRYRRIREKEGIKSVLVNKEGYEKPCDKKRRKRNAATYRQKKENRSSNY